MKFDLDFILIVSSLSNAYEIGTFTKYVSACRFDTQYVSLSSQLLQSVLLGSVILATDAGCVTIVRLAYSAVKLEQADRRTSALRRVYVHVTTTTTDSAIYHCQLLSTTTAIVYYYYHYHYYYQSCYASS